MLKTFSLSDIHSQILNFIASVGIEVYDQSDIVLDGKLHRFRTREDSSGEKSGAICIHTDGWPAGYVQDWRKGIKEFWKYDTSGLDEEQRKYFNSDEYRKKCEEQARKAEQKRRAEQLKASEAARRLWEKLPRAPQNHPYILRKQIIWLNETCLRYNPATKSLAVPLTDISGKIQSIQWIQEDGHKTFFEGASVDGAFWECWLDGAMGQDPKGIILLGEGFATMTLIFELTHRPVVAAMSCYNLENVAKKLREKYPQAKIVIAADNDHKTQLKRGKNPGIDCAINLKKSSVHGKPLADGLIYPEFQPEEDGSDWDDYAILHGDDLTTAKLKNEIASSLIPDKIRDLMQKKRLQIINAQALRSKVFQPIKWAIPGMLPSGLSILGGGPKIGKSFFALQTSLAVAVGGYALGKIPVTQGDVLYLALEDNERRLQERIANSNAVSDTDDISRLTLAYTVPRQHEGGLEFIVWWAQSVENPRLVVIDTFQKFRKQLSNKGNIYAEDYDVLSEIKRIADLYDIAILILHHLKKVSPKNELNMDWIDLFSGSAGISGSADALFVLKRARDSVYGKLFRTGRDVEEAVFSLKLDGFGWYLDDTVEAFVLPTWKKQIIDFLKDHPTVTPADLATGYDLSMNTAQKNLQRLEKEGLIIKISRGQYKLPEETKN